MSETTATTWATDTEFENVTLAEVRRDGNGYVLKRTDGWSLFIDDPGFAPQPGSRARFYGNGIGYPVRGVVIDDRLCFYRTKAEQERHHTDGLYPPTAAEALARWDKGDNLFTVEMGGLGPGYEQSIQVLMFELLRRVPASAVADEQDYRRRCDEVIADVDQHLGLSGAQCGAAQWLAFRALRDGWQNTLLATPDERRIQVSKHWPRIPDGQ